MSLEETAWTLGILGVIVGLAIAFPSVAFLIFFIWLVKQIG